MDLKSGGNKNKKKQKEKKVLVGKTTKLKNVYSNSRPKG